MNTTERPTVTRCPGCGEDWLVEFDRVLERWVCAVCMWTWRTADNGTSQTRTNNAVLNRTVIDIETVAIHDAADYIETPTAPANYKDEAKIAAYVAERKAELVNRSALDADLCRVVAFGWDGGGVAVETSETAALSLFAGLLRRGHVLIGFNLLSFDLPVLIRRCQYLGIELPRVELGRYRTPHIDLMRKLSFDGAIRAHSLNFYCRRFGIDVPDETSGSQIGELVRSGNWQAVEAHCRADVVKTRALAEKLGYLA